MLDLSIHSYCAHCRIAIGKVNAFAPEDIRELDDLLAHCEALFPDTVRVLSIESQCVSPGGLKVFCAGADQKVRAGWSNARILAYLAYQRRVIHRLRMSPVWVISCVDGLALGLGAEICLASDFVLAGEEAFWGFPEKDWGIVPGAGGFAWAHGWAEKPELAQEMIRTGERIDREHAQYLGIADILCDGADFCSMSEAFAQELAGLDPDDQHDRKKRHHEKIDYEKYFALEQSAYRQCLENRVVK
ncbi:MAG: enoyl-CoA hydratase/isomerase family protein [Proteobacteria bacterium]|nr:enoyl-CoA hydratase/isomerase family protein [Pseudomonadota bacterium]